MTLVIDATAGGANSNSFVLLSEAQTYIDARLNSTAWAGASTADQNAALVEATRDISNKGFDGVRTTTTQRLSWPRQWAHDPDSPWTWYFDSSVIPQRVKDATCELAFQFLNAGTTDLAVADTNAGVIEKTADVLTTRWDVNRKPTGLARFPRVLDYLRPLLSAGGNTFPIVRG